MCVCVCFLRKLLKMPILGGKGTEYANKKKLTTESTDEFSICLELLIKTLLKVDNRM